MLRGHKQAARDGVIPLQYGLGNGSGPSTVKVSAGQLIYVSARDGVNVDERIWGDDAYKFNPERWLSSEGNFDLNVLPQSARDIQVIGNMLTFGAGYDAFLTRCIETNMVPDL